MRVVLEAAAAVLIGVVTRIVAAALAVGARVGEEIRSVRIALTILATLRVRVTLRSSTSSTHGTRNTHGTGSTCGKSSTSNTSSTTMLLGQGNHSSTCPLGQSGPQARLLVEHAASLSAVQKEVQCVPRHVAHGSPVAENREAVMATTLELGMHALLIKDRRSPTLYALEHLPFG